MPARPEHPAHRGVQPLKVSMVRHHEQRTPPTRNTRGRRRRKGSGPITGRIPRDRQRRPHRTDRGPVPHVLEKG